MKKAEVIKNGNVNLKPIKTGIDWDKIERDYVKWVNKRWEKHDFIRIEDVIKWYKKRIEKELNGML
jgi:hypothetical protein